MALIKEGTTKTSGLRSGSGGRKQTNLVEYIIIRNQNLKGNGNKKEDNTDDDEHGHKLSVAKTQLHTKGVEDVMHLCMHLNNRKGKEDDLDWTKHRVANLLVIVFLGM